MALHLIGIPALYGGWRHWLYAFPTSVPIRPIVWLKDTTIRSKDMDRFLSLSCKDYPNLAQMIGL